MWENIQSGGPIMVPILILSILALMSFLERCWTLNRIVEPSKTRLAQLIHSLPPHALETRITEEGRHLVGQLERRTFILGVAATVAPMLGLLGTVLGMIITFDDIQQSGIGDPQLLAGGISQALITTFAGLSVGIPSLIGHRYILREIDRIALELEVFCREEIESKS